MFPWCLVAFQKFSGKYFLVFGKEEGKHKSRNTQATTQKKIINDDKSSPTTAPSIAIRDCDQRRDRDLAFFARSRTTTRSCEGEIAIFARSRSTARSREASIAISDLPLSPTYEISRSTLREITPSIAISRRQDRDQRRDLATTRSQSTATGMFAGEIAIGAEWRSRSCACSLSLSLSLSHFPEIL